MSRIPRNFQLRSPDEQFWFQDQTWCNYCNQADIGLKNPLEYEEDGKIYVEGNCRRCGKTVRSEITEKQI
jgi:hypothetical protein